MEQNRKPRIRCQYNFPFNMWIFKSVNSIKLPDWKNIQGKKKTILEISPKPKLDLPYSSNYLHSIYIVSGVMGSSGDNLKFKVSEWVYRIKQMLLHLYGSWASVDFSVCRSSWKQSPGIPKENCTCEKLEFKFRDKGFFT